ncbi:MULTISPECIES: aminopeptidase N [unclassified Streptomyces]|uniref:aminopeptidase N n=1 Tax=unclassified Streptomyces TaxID=2593676 RepID=UPI002E80BB16|nr:aminopeptidase N [Streptomyces sp. NBC_00589]WTI39179.1 aminopeptidase N [Streptomyces sp. NBC_00775]WUB27142.1 aminopeptidase N [Streptomyces sp. NBC_00589]
MPGTNLTREEAQQRASLLTVDSYEIDLDLSGAQEGGTYRSVTTVRFDVENSGAESFIDLVAPTVHEVTLNGDALDPAEVFKDSRIALPGLLAGRNVLRVVADCAYTNTGEGLHRFVDPVDQQAYLYTQFEVPDARRVFASFEQPDLKATFQFTVKAPSGWTVISNSPTPEPKASLPNVWAFEPTPRISTYITALIVGPYHSVHSVYEKDGQSVPLGIYCRPSLAEFLDSDAIFEVTRQGFDWFQEKFDYAYPFKKYDQLFVPEFNAGAMENAGAVTIRDQYVFRSKVTDAAYEVRAETILHELAHMWFGDLVTMEWWNDLWLNESFATYTSIACQAYAPDSRWPHSWTTFANSMKTWAYRQDQLPSTHPIMAEIRDLDDVLVNFDGITYAKGASVLKQLVAYVGMDEFFKGVQAYFKAHAYGNTRLSDLLGALEETSGRDLGTWSQKWLQTAGINILRPEIETDANGVITAFAIRQEAPALPTGAKGEPTLRPHRIAVGLYDLDDDSGKLVRDERLELDVDGELTAVPQLVGKRRPNVILLNDDDLSYAKVRLDEASLAFVTEHLGDFQSSLPRALCWASAWDMTRDAELATRDYLSLVLSGIGKESDIGVVQSLQRQVKLAIELYADPTAREALLTRWTDATLAHLRTAEPAGDHQLAWARAFAATARTPEQLDLLEALLEGRETIEGLAVDTELRWAFVERLAAVGRFDDAEIAAEYERDKTAAGERHAATARAARPTEEAKTEAWASVVESDKLPNAVQEAVIGGFVQTGQRELLAPYTDKFFAVVKELWDSRSHEIAQQIAVGLYPSIQVSEETLAKTDTWLASAEPNAALRRLISESRSGVERALKAQAADARAANA